MAKSGRSFVSRYAVGFCAVAIVAVAVSTFLCSRSASPNGISQNATPISKIEAATRISQIPIYFEKNQGQTDSQVRYLSRAGDYTLFLTDDSAIVAMEHHPRPKMPSWYSVMNGNPSMLDKSANENQVETAALRVKMLGANHRAAIEGLDKMPGRVNYMIGKSSGWHTNVPLFGSVRYRSIYSGIDVVYYG